MKMKLWHLMLFVVILILSTQCVKPRARGDHSWKDCDPEISGPENITDPQMDRDPERDHVVIDFRGATPLFIIRGLTHEMGLDLEVATATGEKHKLYRAEVPEGAVPRIKAHIRKHKPLYSLFVKRVEEEFYVQGITAKRRARARALALDTKPDDPLYQYQWNLDQIHVEDAWLRGVTGRRQVVAVLDTGVAPSKADPEYKAYKPLRDFERTSFVPGYNFVENRTFAGDDHGHGTHVAGTIAQSTHNGYGVAGVAYGASIMPVRVLGRDGSGTTTQIAKGIRFAVDNGAHIINLSLGSSRPSQIIEDAVKYAHARNVLVIGAAGNSGKKELTWPAAYDEVMAVAATQYDGHPAFYSQWGPFVDIAAPGGNVREDQNKDGKPDGILQETVAEGHPGQHEFALFMGTSMATPHVTGAAALVRSTGITNPAVIRHYLGATADKSMLEGDETPEEGAILKEKTYPQKEFQERYGSGTLDAGQAVTEALRVPARHRAFVTFLLSLLLIISVRRQDVLDSNLRQIAIFMGTSLFFSAGLFFLTPFSGVPAGWLMAPMKWEFYVMGQTNLTFISIILPILLISLFNRTENLRYVATGVATGLAGFYFAEAYMLTSPLWILGSGPGARVLLISAGIIVSLLTYQALRR